MRLTIILATLALAAAPLQVFAQAAPPSGDLELETRKKATVVAPKPTDATTAKDAAAARGAMEQRRAVKEAVKRPTPSRPNGDLSGGIQSRGVQREMKP